MVLIIENPEVYARRIDSKKLLKDKVMAVLAEIDIGTNFDDALRINGIHVSKKLCDDEPSDVENSSDVYSPNALFDLQVQIETLMTLQKRMEIESAIDDKRSFS